MKELRPGDPILIKAVYSPKGATDGNMKRVVTAEEGAVVWVKESEIMPAEISTCDGCAAWKLP